MQIQKINNVNYNQTTQHNPQFKKAYGVTPLQFRNGKSSPMPKRSMSL